MELINQQQIERRILTFRETQVMLDRDIAELYQVETRVIIQAVKRNKDRFPEEFMFQLNSVEFSNWKSQIVMSNSDKMGLRRPPYAFTEQGVAMLSAVLRIDVAVKISIQIMQAFVKMRKFLIQNVSVFQRLDHLELKQLQSDEKFNQIFKALEAGQPKPDKGIFFDGQVFDAYAFVADLIKKAKKEIILIDNYIDESVLTLLSKRQKDVSAILYTRSISKTLQLDLEKHHAQYPEIQVKTFAQSHDRFLLIDQSDLYHIGASLKDLGKKWFAFSRMDSMTALLLNQLKNVK
jgi:hypothetical protein